MRIENYREQPSGKSLQAVFDVYLEGICLTLRSLKVCLNKNGKHFIGYPSFTVDMGEEKKWVHYFEFSKEKRKEFEQKLWEELANFMRGPIYR